MRLHSGDKHHLRKSANRKAQISLVSGTNAFLTCALRSVFDYDAHVLELVSRMKLRSAVSFSRRGGLRLDRVQ